MTSTGESPGPDQPRPVPFDPSPPRRRLGRAGRGSSRDGRIGQTLRLSPEAWKQLKVLAAKERVNAHDLLIEGTNLLFRERGLPEVA